MVKNDEQLILFIVLAFEQDNKQFYAICDFTQGERGKIPYAFYCTYIKKYNIFFDNVLTLITFTIPLTLCQFFR